MQRRTSFLGLIQGLSKLTSTTPGKVGLSLTCAFLIIAALAPWIAPYSPFVTSGPSYAVPTWSHLLGTDDIGEDIFSQLIFAARGSLLVAFGAGVLSTGIGIFVGLVSGYYAGRLGEGLMRVTDVMLVLPVLPLLIVIAAFFPPSVWLVIVVIGIVSWAPTARVIRSQTLSLKARPFVDSCRLSGMSDFEVMFRVLLRNEIPLIIVYGVYTAITAVVLESALDFIGLGSVENLSWGVMLYFALARNALARGSWWWFLPPGFLIALLGTGLILTGYAVERVSRTGL